MTLTETQTKRLVTALYVLLILGSLYLFSRALTEFKTAAQIGKTPSQNIISVNGKGDAYAVPDIATLSFDVMYEAKTVAEAQANVTKRANDILAYLKTAGIKEVDVKTTNYQIYPRYEYNARPMCYSADGCPNNNSQVFIGYDVTSSFQVKIRNTADAGKILSEIGTRKVTNLSGLTFTNEDENAAKTAARKNAIEDAKRKAEVLAKDLGVSLGKITNFSENGGGYPMYYAKTMSMDAGAMGEAAPSPELPVGQNKTSVEVTITYEIE